jgi:hypothetical protein
MAVEFSPLGPIATIRDAVMRAASHAGGRVGLMIDSWHFSFGESTWEDLATVPLDDIAYCSSPTHLNPIPVSASSARPCIAAHCRARACSSLIDSPEYCWTEATTPRPRTGFLDRSQVDDSDLFLPAS